MFCGIGVIFNQILYAYYCRSFLCGYLTIIKVAADAQEVACDAREVARDAREVARDVREVARDVREVAPDVREVAPDALRNTLYSFIIFVVVGC